jgi:alanine dehydrogenase
MRQFVKNKILDLLDKKLIYFLDVSIDQGGCFETSKPTTHQDPTFVVDEVIHYCVTNIPSVVPRTSTFALTNVTLPYVLEISNKGIKRAIRENCILARGVNVYKGAITHPCVANSMGCLCEDFSKIL